MPPPAVHVVDLEPFRIGGPDDRMAVAQRIDEACRDSGFLQLTGHGVPVELCDQLLDAWAAFFDLPADEKERWVVADVSANRGYTEVGKEGLAYSRGETSPPDLFEAFTFGREDATGLYYDRHRSFYAPNRWPANPPGLREAWVAYEHAVSIVVADAVLSAMALALDLPAPWFAERCRRAIVTTRMLNYQRAPGVPDPEPGQMRLGAHTDYGILTVLLADEAPGLQVHRDGEWQDVTTPRGTFTCNLGDMLARWTNDRWTSTLHRVMPPPTAIDGPRRRSVARFLDCEPDLVVECIPSCCSPSQPAKYEPVVAGEWLLAKLVGGKTREVAYLPVAR